MMRSFLRRFVSVAETIDVDPSCGCTPWKHTLMVFDGAYLTLSAFIKDWPSNWRIELPAWAARYFDERRGAPAMWAGSDCPNQRRKAS